jgi:hypothetical protein
MVNAISRPVFLVLGLMSTGMPRPLSTTRMASSGRIVTSMESQKPAMASSTALSTTS